MTTTITTTAEISLAKLVPSPANVRRTGARAGIDALAASIQAHGLLQSLVVRPKLGSNGQPTGQYEVVAGGRRLAALKLLAKGKRITKAVAIPCRVLDQAGTAGAEASLAENMVRLDMHPADQFEAFAGLHDGGMGIEDIAARFGVSAHTVRQRLRLAGISPALIQAYRDAVLTLDHLTAFAVTEDRAAQERVFEQLQPWQRNPDTIRRLLTHALIPATDRKVIFVGLDAYTAAGGTVKRDLFSEDRGGWIADAALLERLVAERMEAAAATIRAEGWRWVAIGPEAQAAAWGMRRVWPNQVALCPEDEQRRGELASRYDELADQHNRDAENLPDDVAAELDRIEAELARLEARTEAWQPTDVAVSGVVLTLTADGRLCTDRGWVRPEDEPATEERNDDNGPRGTVADGAHALEDGSPVTPVRPSPVPEANAPALSAALLAELQAHRTAGLQAAVARQPDLALRVMVHALATDTFYRRYGETVAFFQSYPPALATCRGIADNPARQALAKAEHAWRTRLPEAQALFWDWLQRQDVATLLDLLAVCLARSVNAGAGPWTTPEGSRCMAAQVATTAKLDMRTCWTPTQDSYFAKVPKALVLEAVRDGAGVTAARRIAGAKKEVMVADAEQLLAGTGWLPAMLHVPGTTYPVDSTDAGRATDPSMPIAAE